MQLRNSMAAEIDASEDPSRELLRPLEINREVKLLGFRKGRLVLRQKATGLDNKKGLWTTTGEVGSGVDSYWQSIKGLMQRRFPVVEEKPKYLGGIKTLERDRLSLTAVFMADIGSVPVPSTFQYRNISDFALEQVAALLEKGKLTQSCSGAFKLYAAHLIRDGRLAAIDPTVYNIEEYGINRNS